MKLLVVSNRVIENGTFFQNQDDLYDFLERKANYNITTLIFAFWSWVVPERILLNYKCYGLHTGPLLEGKGKGGSPIDNLQALGINWTTLCTFEMTDKIDEGKVKVAIPFNIHASKEFLIRCIDDTIPAIVNYLQQDNSAIPEHFKRLPNVQ